MTGSISVGVGVGSGLMIGVLISYLVNLPHRLIAAIMGFGGGVLNSVLAFELIEEAYIHGGLLASVFGFLFGAVLFSFANWLLVRSGSKQRKRRSECIVQFSEYKKKGYGRYTRGHYCRYFPDR